MTIETTTNRKEYAGDDVTLAFSFPYYFLADADLKVYLNDTLQTITTHYTVSGAGVGAGGTVTFVAAPATGDTVVILRDPAITQSTDWVENDPDSAAVKEEAFDRLTMIAQRLQDQIDRTFSLQDSDVGVDLSFSTIVADGYWKWDSLGTSVSFVPASSGLADAASVTYTPGGSGAVATDVQSKLREWMSVKDFGATGDGVTNDTAAIQAAIDAVGANGMLYFPEGTYLVTSELTVSDHRVHLFGAGPYASQLLFTPTTAATCLRINDTASPLYQGSVSNLSFYSGDSTYKKIAIDIVDTSGWRFENIVIGGSVVHGGSTFWSGADSIGIQTRGREFGLIKNIYNFADRPLVIAIDPNIASISLDHFHFENMYLGAYGNPCVEVETGTYLTQVTFDGANPWVLGEEGFKWVDTTSTGASNGLTLAGIRTEQGTDPTKYSIHIDHNYELQNLDVRDCNFDSSREGFYFRECTEVGLSGSAYTGGAGRVSINVDATVERMSFRNMFWQTGSTATLTGQRLLFGGPAVAGGTSLPQDAIYGPSANADRQMTIGGAIQEYEVELDDTDVALLAPNGSGGTIFLQDSEGYGAMFFLNGTNGTVVEVADSAGIYSITASTASSTNVYWSAGNTRYEIENLRGATRRYKVTLIGTYSTF